MRELHIKTKLMQPHQLQSTNNPNYHSLHKLEREYENNPTDLENLYPQTCFKNESGYDDFKETSRNLDVLLKIQRTKEELK